MSRIPRFIPPSSILELTTRTNGGRYYLRPSEPLNAAITTAIARAVVHYPVAVHSFVFLSNHWHALITTPDAAATRGFLRSVNSAVAKAAQRVNGVTGTVFQRRAQVIPVLDEGAQLARLRYQLAHGTKEHLVPHPCEWPGVTTARALIGEELLAGTWVDRKQLWNRSRRGRLPDASASTVSMPIELTPLPALAHLSEAAQWAVIGRMLEEIVEEHPGPFFGVEAVLSQDVNAAPLQASRSRPPLAHATCAQLRERYRALLLEFRDAYRAAAQEHVSTPTIVAWPGDAFLPASVFVQEEATRSLSAMLWSAL